MPLERIEREEDKVDTDWRRARTELFSAMLFWVPDMLTMNSILVVL